MGYLQDIKDRVAKYCKENQAILPVNREYLRLKQEYAIKSFYGLPTAYQQLVRAFIEDTDAQIVYLVGSLASGAGIIPEVTPQHFIELRNKHSHKTRKKKSDVDLYGLDRNGDQILKRVKNPTVNIESLPARFEPAVLIYKNGQYL